MEDDDRNVTVPLEYFSELQANAQTPPSGKERVGQSLQTTAVFAGMSLAVVGASWGVTRAMDWLEERRARRSSERYAKEHPETPTE